MTHRTWECDLSIRLTNATTLACHGSITCTAVGKIEITAKTTGLYNLDNFLDNQSIIGTTSDGMKVSIKGAFPNSVSFDSNSGFSTVSFSLISCKLTIPSMTTITSAKYYLKSLSMIGPSKFTHTGKNCELSSLNNVNDRTPGLIRATLKMDWPIEPTDILILLSLAQRCMIAAPLQEFYNDNNLVSINLFPNDEPTVATHPLIPLSGGDIAKYLNMCLPNFILHWKNYQLDKLISFYCLSVGHSYGEIKFILASVFMEALKFHWALNVGMKTPIRKSTGIIKGFQKALNRKGDPVLYTFEDLLNETCTSIGYNTTFTFIEDRNALFHSGVPGDLHSHQTGSWQAIKPELIALYKQIDDILLTILGYNGNIARWNTPDDTISFP